MRMARKLQNKGFEVSCPADTPVAPRTWCLGYVSD